MAGSSDLRKFRSDVALLKRKGLLTGVDARSATPTPKLRKTLARYDDVLSGKVTPVKLSAEGLKEYKKLGKPYDIAAPKGLPRRVLIPHTATEKVKVSHGKVSIKDAAGVKRTIIPVKYHDLEKYFKDVRKKAPKLGPDEYYAFRFFGNRSHKVFRSIDALLNTLQHYESIFDSIEESDAEQMAELYQNLEIVQVKRPDEWKAAPRRRDVYKAEQSRKRRKRLAQRPEVIQEKQREKNRVAQKEWRNRLKHNPAKWKAYKAAGKKRAKKSAAKRKK